jgi:hypothetical protein
LIRHYLTFGARFVKGQISTPTCEVSGLS